MMASRPPGSSARRVSPQYPGGVRKLVQCTAADGPGEGGVGERQVSGIGPHERRERAQLPGAAGGFLEHGRGDVYADHRPGIAELAL